jgi:hypothetical protein
MIQHHLDHRTVPTGDQLRDTGTAQVLRHNEPYRDRFFAAASMILEASGSVTSDQVVLAIGMPDEGHPSAVGAAMRAFAMANKLRVAGYQKSTRPSCRSAVIARWVRNGSLCGEQGRTSNED